MSRRTTTIDVAEARFEIGHLVLDDLGDKPSRVRIVLTDGTMEYLAEKCVEYFRGRRDRAANAIKRLAAECAR